MPLPTPSTTIAARTVRFKRSGQNFPRNLVVGEVVKHGSGSFQILSVTVQVWEPKVNVYLGELVSVTVTFDGHTDATFWVPTNDLKYIEQLP
jgi:hypothetical protein